MSLLAVVSFFIVAITWPLALVPFVWTWYVVNDWRTSARRRDRAGRLQLPKGRR